MNPFERDDPAPAAPAEERGALYGLLGRQALTLLASLALGPPLLGLGWTPAAASLGWFAVAWAWGKSAAGRNPSLLLRATVQRLARGSGGLVGGAVGAGWGSYALLHPGEFDAALPTLGLVALLLGTGAALAGAGLTLCALDLARPASD